MTAHLICLAAVSFAEATPSTTTEPEIRQIEWSIIHYTNYERQRHGLPPLTLDQSLLRSARRHASWMASSRALVHTSAPVAENIAMGQRTSLDAVRDWMNSSGHRANILSRGHSRVGAAAYVSAGGTIYWCLQLR
jgi:uncharacterized protein YkwD